MSTTATAAASVTPPTGDVPTVPIYRLSVAQYRAMAEHGILGPQDRVELLHGWLVPKMSINEPHALCCDLLHDHLPVHLPAGWCLRVQNPVRLATSTPEPDGAITRGARRDYHRAGTPPTGSDLALVIEVADLSLELDRQVKAPAYAAELIPIYWIVNLVDHRIEVYTDPSGPTASPCYATRHDYYPGQDIPLVVAGAAVAHIPVADLLP